MYILRKYLYIYFRKICSYIYIFLYIFFLLHPLHSGSSVVVNEGTLDAVGSSVTPYCVPEKAISFSQRDRLVSV